MSRCLNPIFWLLSLLMIWPELVFGAEAKRAAETVRIGPDFGPLVDAA